MSKDSSGGITAAADAARARLTLSVATLFPPGVVVAELAGSAAPGELTARERDCIAHCAPARIRQFAAGRACAHRALQQLGIDEFSLLVGTDRQPVWPTGIVGSLTHTDDYAAAAVGRDDALLGLGLDCEGADRVKSHLWKRIATPPELEWLNALEPGPAGRAASLLFAAKEAFYKCQFPLTTEWLGFEDVSIELDAVGVDWSGGEAGGQEVGRGVDRGVGQAGSEAGASGVATGELRVLPRRPLSIQAHCPTPWRGRFLFEGGRVVVGVSLLPAS